MAEHLSEKQLKALEAEGLLKNPTLRGAFIDCESDLMSKLKTVDITDTLKMEKLVLSLQQLQSIVETLRGYITDAEVEVQPIEEY